MSKLVESLRYSDTVWCLCNSFLDYKQFVKDIYVYKKSSGCFGGEQFEYEEEWFGEDRKSTWMDLFGVQYIKDDPDDPYSDEYEIENPLMDEYVVNEMPEENEYPAIVRYSLIDNCLDWCSVDTNFNTDMILDQLEDYAKYKGVLCCDEDKCENYIPVSVAKQIVKGRGLGGVLGYMEKDNE